MRHLSTVPTRPCAALTAQPDSTGNGRWLNECRTGGRTAIERIGSAGENVGFGVGGVEGGGEVGFKEGGRDGEETAAVGGGGFDGELDGSCSYRVSISSL